MKRFWTAFALMIGIGLAAALPQAQAARPASPLIGSWLGTLQASALALRIVAHFTTKAGGRLAATLDSPDQSALGIPVDAVTVRGRTVHLTVTKVAGAFDGTLQPGGKQIVGRWTQGGSSLPLTLTKTDRIPTVRRPQEPTPPFPYATRDVTFKNPDAEGVTLAGTLTTPPGPGPFPAVVLISGSGPNARDEEILGHKLFLVLADSLTRQGIAVLRYDKRGVGKSTGSYVVATSADFTSDARAAVAYLKTVPQIDPRHIGLIGHSEGGLIAPMVAVQSPDVAFIVLMAGPGMTGEQIMFRQAALIAKAMGAPDTAVARQRALQERMFTVLRQTPNNAEAARRLRAVLTDFLATLTTAERKQIGEQKAFMQAQMRALLTPWFRSFLTYDPLPTLRQVKCPVLAINGSRDLQVPPQEDLDAIAAALKAGGNPDFTVKALPGLNHLFQTSATGSPLEYGKIEETISPLALRTVGGWIHDHTFDKETAQTPPR